jgi:hypothetical protein
MILPNQSKDVRQTLKKLKTAAKKKLRYYGLPVCINQQMQRTAVGLDDMHRCGVFIICQR